MDEKLLVVDKLTTSFQLQNGWYPAIEDLSFSLNRNETLALVGESGCGKSVTAYSIMNLLPKPGSRIDRGRVLFNGKDLVGLSSGEMRSLRGSKLAMIFQEPMTSLNPALSIGKQIAEVLYYHNGTSKKEALKGALELLEQVKIPAAANRLNDYPHHLSGGMRQRVMIAMALAGRPEIMLADEPTTALDVTIQAQVLALLDDLKKEMKMSMIFITHDMGVVARVADRVAVMYGGYLAEVAPVEELFANPTHPYTEALLQSMPRLDRDIDNLKPIPGLVPSIDRMPKGCRFAERCRHKIPRCEQLMPELLPVNSDGTHTVRCWVRASQNISSGDAKV
ncbi:MAG: ABC transporter ATP-binding protein [Desulfuromonadales bacterium]|nr:ABC transporter ATP-binding protein [Desulfuromonadales bacterium]